MTSKCDVVTWSGSCVAYVLCFEELPVILAAASRVLLYLTPKGSRFWGKAQSCGPRNAAYVFNWVCRRD